MVSFCHRPPAEGAATGVERVAEARLPTAHGEFVAVAYRDAGGIEHLALTRSFDAAAVPLVRVHSECLTGDVLGSARCDCGSQLERAMAIVGAEGGVVVYVRGHEGRGIGLGHKLAAYALQDQGLDTVDANEALGFPADARTYDVASAILADLGLVRVRLLTNNPAKSEGLAGLGIEVVERVALPGLTTEENLRYLQTKRERMAHVLELTPPAGEESA